MRIGSFAAPRSQNSASSIHNRPVSSDCVQSGCHPIAFLILVIILFAFTLPCSAGRHKIGVDFCEPCTARLESKTYVLLTGNDLDDKRISAVRLVPTSNPVDTFTGLVSSEAAALPFYANRFKNEIYLDVNAELGGKRRGIHFTLPQSAPVGQYWLQLLDKAGAPLAGVPIFVTRALKEPAGSTDATKIESNYVECVNGNPEFANSPEKKSNPIYCSYSLLRKEEASDNFGSHVSKLYYAIQVGVVNNDSQYDYLLRDIVLSLPDGRHISARVKRFAQGVAVKGQINDPRNRWYNGLNWASSIFGGLTIFSFATTDLKNSANLVQGAGLTGFNQMFPDVSVDNVNRFNNAVFDDAQATIVPKKGVAQPSVFVVALVPRLKGASDAYTERFGEQISVSVSGAHIQPVNLVTISPDSLNFERQSVGVASPPQFVTIKNSNQVPVPFSVATNPSRLFQLTNPCGNTILAQADCRLEVRFAAEKVDKVEGQLTINGSFIGSPYVVSLTGTGAPIQVTPSSVSFDSVFVGKNQNKPVSITNLGPKTSISVTSTEAAPQAFSFKLTNCDNLSSNAACTLDVTFAPSTPGDKSTTASLAGPKGDVIQTISVSGKGVKQTPTLTLAAPSQSELTVGNEITLNASGTSGLPVKYEFTGPIEKVPDSTNKFRLTGTGIVTVTVKQDGNEMFEPAEAKQTFEVKTQPTTPEKQ